MLKLSLSVITKNSAKLSQIETNHTCLIIINFYFYCSFETIISSINLLSHLLKLTNIKEETNEINLKALI